MERITKTYMQSLLIAINPAPFYRSYKKSDLGQMKAVFVEAF